MAFSEEETLINKETRLTQSKITNKASEYINPTNLIKNPSSLWTTLREPIKDPKKMKFFGFRFLSVLVFPMPAMGILMEFLFISPTKGTIPLG